MANVPATTTTLNGLFKQVYGDEVIDLVPEENLILQGVPFSKSDKMGDKYNQPVVVQQEHGFTFSGPNSGAFNLNDAVSMRTQNAQVDAYQIVLRGQMSYEAASKAANGGAASFMDATQLQTQNMVESTARVLEVQCLYGQSATGIGGVADTTNVSTTSTSILFSAAGWAAGTWAGMENAPIDIFQSNGTKLNSNAPLTISTVSVASRTIVVTTTSTADITAIDTYFDGTATGYVNYYGAAGNDMAGLDKIITNSGTLFNINAATYNLWAGNSYAVGGNLSFAKLQAGVAVAQSRGLKEDVQVLINPVTWQYLVTEQSALRMYDSSYSTGELDNGSKTLRFYSQNGVLEVKSHIYVKQGDGFIVPFKRLKRVGAQDMSFTSPGNFETGEIFTQLQAQAGFEYRIFSDQAIFCEKPATTVKLTGITNS